MDAVSYGGRWALEVMRDFPGVVASAVLDSPVPLQVALPAMALANAQRSFGVFFRGCADAPGCSAAYPDLETGFYDLVGTLNATPATITLTHPQTGKTAEMLLTGDRLVNFLFAGLSQTNLIPQLPMLIAGVQAGDYAAFAKVESQIVFGGDSASQGLSVSVFCSDWSGFTSQEEVDATRAQLRPEIAAAIDDILPAPLCAGWGAAQADPIEHQAVSSVIPALVMAGEYDPRVPPAGVEQAGREYALEQRLRRVPGCRPHGLHHQPLFAEDFQRVRR
jgi:pimeloyl-ACP methyl ester carboxylesterase